MAVPLHARACPSRSRRSVQNATPHRRAIFGSEQALPFVPSQNPPHAPDPGHAGRRRRAGPRTTAMQVPTLLAWLHDRHWPVLGAGRSTRRPRS